ncbi:hypothetical protein JCM17823_14650 [Halorubrum gandharaense]
MGDVTTTPMGDQRALLTDTERRILTGEKDVKDNYRYSVESRVRARLDDVLREDLEVLAEHHPKMYETVVETVCDEDHG